MIAATILSLLLAGMSPAADSWHAHYVQGVRLIERGDSPAARAELEPALRLRGKEGLQLSTGPQQYLDYMPHLYLAVALQMSGDVQGARKQLALAEDSGVASKSEVGRPLLVAYQLLLKGNVSGTSRPLYAVYKPKKPILSETEFNVLRTDVLTKCDLPADIRQSDAPWFANYELGLELERKGDYPRALTHFIDAVERRPAPQRRARTYGVWMIDYYPYFHIARSHVRLENWQCAKNALEISQKLGEIPSNAPESTEYTALYRETEHRLATTRQ